MNIINGAGNHEFMIRPDAFSAQNAFAEIPDDKRIELLIGGIIRHGVESAIPHPKISGNLSQFAPVAFAADNAGFRMLGHHQAHNIASVV